MCVCVVWVNQERCVSRVEVILNGVWSVCLSAPLSLFIAQSCGTNLLIEFEAGKDVAGGFVKETWKHVIPLRVCLYVEGREGMIECLHAKIVYTWV